MRCAYCAPSTVLAANGLPTPDYGTVKNGPSIQATSQYDTSIRPRQAEHVLGQEAQDQVR